MLRYIFHRRRRRRGFNGIALSPGAFRNVVEEHPAVHPPTGRRRRRLRSPPCFRRVYIIYMDIRVNRTPCHTRLVQFLIPFTFRRY